METVINSKANDYVGLNIDTNEFTEEKAVAAMTKLKDAATAVRDAFFMVATDDSDMECCPSFIKAQEAVNDLITLIGRKYGEVMAERIISD